MAVIRRPPTVLQDALANITSRGYVSPLYAFALVSNPAKYLIILLQAMSPALVCHKEFEMGSDEAQLIAAGNLALYRVVECRCLHVHASKFLQVLPVIRLIIDSPWELVG